MDWSTINKGTLDDFGYPQTLYKYRDWNSKHHDRFIKNREIFLASPSTFKDPKDCKNPVRYDLLSEKQTLIWYEKISKREYPWLTRQQHRQKARNWVKNKFFKDEDFLKQYQEKYNTELDLIQGVLSLTAEPNLPEMWNEYAGNDTGFCVGYNSRILFEFLGGGGNVNYCDELPTILPSPLMPHLEIRHKRIYYKERKYILEKEYRTERLWKSPAMISDRQIQLPKNAFNIIILGDKISDTVRENIIINTKKEIGNDIPIIDRKNLGTHLKSK